MHQGIEPIISFTAHFHPGGESMVTFENFLKKEKYEILKEVISLVKHDALNKEEIEKLSNNIVENLEEHCRCCAYKEKAIVAQKIRLGMGCSPAEDEFEFKNIMAYKQIVHIMRAACDSCPINRFTVTEACRGCIQHSCINICPVNAIVRVNGRAYINQSICRECGLCKSICPYNAISEVIRPCKVSCPTGALDIDKKERKAMINEPNCINCGACMTACPFGAISDKSCMVSILDKLLNKNENNIYALVAPAIGGQFDSNISLGKLQNALQNIGFKSLVEASLGADIVTAVESKEFIEKMNSGSKFMTTSCCPAFVSYIEMEFPELKENISSTVSPMIATAQYIKSIDKKAIVVFIGPCVAKKNEIKKEKPSGFVDFVMTFEELAALFKAFDVDPRYCQDTEINDGSLYGRNFAQSGGVTDSIRRYIEEKHIDVEFKPVKASGIDDIKRQLRLAKLGKLDGNFIEGMMCEGGCIGGPAAICGLKKAKTNIKKFNCDSKIKNISENNRIYKSEDIQMHI